MAHSVIRLLTAPKSLPLSSALALPVAAVMTLLAFWFVTLAVTITARPTLVSMLRSTEIILSLVTESVWWGQPPHYLSIIGSLLVTLGDIVRLGSHWSNYNITALSLVESLRIHSHATPTPFML